jgi:hypothetical protein
VAEDAMARLFEKWSSEPGFFHSRAHKLN